jgi:hypothetical protein
MNIVYKKSGITLVELILSVFILSTVLTVFLKTFTIISLRSSAAAHYSKAFTMAQESLNLIEKELIKGDAVNLCNRPFSLSRIPKTDIHFRQNIRCYQKDDELIAEFLISWDFQGNANVLPVKFIL